MRPKAREEKRFSEQRDECFIFISTGKFILLSSGSNSITSRDNFLTRVSFAFLSFLSKRWKEFPQKTLEGEEIQYESKAFPNGDFVFNLELRCSGRVNKVSKAIVLTQIDDVFGKFFFRVLMKNINCGDSKPSHENNKREEYFYFHRKLS